MRAVTEDLEALENLVPGGVVVVRLGEEIQPLAFGQADTRAGRAMRADHRFQIGSITKTMVATLVLQLVEDGDLSLDDPVAAHLPGLLPRGDQITVEHLLSHRSGLYDYPAATGMDFTRTWQPHELIDTAARRPLRSEPGTRFLYSNTNYIVLALIAERVTGQPVEQLLKRRVFDPAGMGDTSLDRGRVSAPPIAHGYGDGRDVTATDLSLAWAAGGVVSTAPDVTRFIEALFQQDRWGADLLTEMSTWRDQEYGLGYGLGLGSRPISCGQAWGHDGEIPGFTSNAWSLPDGTRSVVILVNEAGYFAAATEIIDAALCT